ncbi:hypothetical protein GCM10025331_05720 [Actinoplanes utahensis]
MSHSPRGDLHTGIRAASRVNTREAAQKFPHPAPGYPDTMTDERTGRRAADLLPEERAAGSADPQAQAEAILADSDERTDDPTAAPDSFLERRTSDESV